MKIIINETQLNRLRKDIISEEAFTADNIAKAMKDVLSGKYVNTSDEPSNSQYNDNDGGIPKGTSGEPVKLDLTKNEDFKKYSEICNRFISRYKNPLHITGDMLANGAKSAFVKTGNYVPPELALSQLLLEGGLTGKESSRPIRTKNPFNVGNTDSGANIFHNDVQSGINTYYDLIARRYLTKGKTVNDLLRNFVNDKGLNYATSSYGNNLSGITKQVASISNQVLGTSDQNFA